MAIDQWCQRAEILDSQPRVPGGLPEDPLQHQGIDIDQGVLEEMQGEHRQFLVFPPIRRDIPAFAKEDEIIRAVPILHDIEPLVNLTAEFAEPEIAAEEDGPARFAQFQEGGVGRMLGSQALSAENLR
jgi:hypothetical protein